MLYKEERQIRLKVMNFAWVRRFIQIAIYEQQLKL